MADSPRGAGVWTHSTEARSGPPATCLPIGAVLWGEDAYSTAAWGAAKLRPNRTAFKQSRQS
eukprot:15339787-Alexandrium_andersonii.AAC.1